MPRINAACIEMQSHSNPDMDAAVNQIKLLADAADQETRRKLIEALNNVILSLEDESDTVCRYGYTVSQLKTL